MRSSMGSVFHLPLQMAESIQETIVALRKEGYTVYTTALDGADMREEFHFRFPCAVVMGNEARGVEPETMRHSHHTVRIPMPGQAESLNVASAAAIMCYAISRDVPAQIESFEKYANQVANEV